VANYRGFVDAKLRGADLFLSVVAPECDAREGCLVGTLRTPDVRTTAHSDVNPIALNSTLAISNSSAFDLLGRTLSLNASATIRTGVHARQPSQAGM